MRSRPPSRRAKRSVGDQVGAGHTQRARDVIETVHQHPVPGVLQIDVERPIHPRSQSHLLLRQTLSSTQLPQPAAESLAPRRTDILGGRHHKNL